MIGNGNLQLGPNGGLLWGAPQNVDLGDAMGLAAQHFPDMEPQLNLRRSGRVPTNVRAQERARQANEVMQDRIAKAKRAEGRKSSRERVAGVRAGTIGVKLKAQGVDWDKVASERVDLSQNEAPQKAEGAKASGKQSDSKAGPIIAKEQADSVTYSGILSMAGVVAALAKGGLVSVSLLGGGVAVITIAVAGFWIYDIWTTEEEIQKAEVFGTKQEGRMKEWESRSGQTVEAWMNRRLIPYISIADYVNSLDRGEKIEIPDSFKLKIATDPGDDDFEPLLLFVQPLTKEEKEEEPPPDYIDPPLLNDFIRRKREYQLTLFLIMVGFILSKKVWDKRNGRLSRSSGSGGSSTK